MKVKLLNDGGFEGFENFNYHAVLEGKPFKCGYPHPELVGVEVAISDLIDAGAAGNVLELAGCKAEEGNLLYFSFKHGEVVGVEK